MSLRSLVLRALAVVFVAAVCTGCCQLLTVPCDCINCLLSGPSIPGFLVKQDGLMQAHPEAQPNAMPRGAVQASMAY